MSKFCAWVVAALLTAPAFGAAQFAASDPNAPQTRTFAQQPIAFELNQGQSDPAARFIARGGDYSIFVAKDEVVFALQDRPAGGPKTPRAVTRLQFAGSNGASAVEGVDLLPGVSNYFRGKDPAKWLRDVPRYAKVRLKNVYAGIDLICYGNDGQLEYDLVVNPGADPSQIRMRSVGTRNLRIDNTGDLVADADRGTIRFLSPVVYDETRTARKDLSARFSLSDSGEIRFQVPEHDRRKTLVIDPVILWSTLHGGNDEDAGQGIATDGTGAAYVTGYTSSTDFPVANPAQGTNGSNYTTDFFDVFVSKFNAGGQTLAYSTYLGGEKDDYGIAIALDSTGAAYVTGRTESVLTFPTTPGAFQPTNNGGNFDAFVSKLNAAGQIVYSTFVGGSLEDGGEGIAVDNTGNAYVAGYTWSINAAPILFPRTVALGPGGGVQDGFSLKLNPAGTGLVYSAIVGGSADETLEALDIDNAGNAYIIGRTQSNDFPTVLPVQATRNGGYDATISRINAAGTALDYSTFLGGDKDDLGIAIEVDGAGNAYGTGRTFKPTSIPYPTTLGAFQAANIGNFDVFVTKLTPAGQYAYSTLLGAPTPTSDDESYGIGIDPKGNATFAGYTDVVGNRDVFLSKLNSTGTAQVYGMLIQGSGEDQGRDLDFDDKGNAFITGFTTSANFGAPLVNPRPGQGPHAGGSSGFVVVMTDSVNLGITKTDGNTTATPGTTSTYTIVVTNTGPTAATGVTVTDNFPAALSGVTWTAATGVPAATGFDPSGSGNINDTGIGLPVGATLTYTVTAPILASATGTVSNTATVAESNDVIDIDTSNNTATDTTLLVPSTNLGITKTDGVTTATPGGSVTYTMTASNAGPNPAVGATVADTFPASLTCTWTCIGAGGGLCTPSGSGNINDSVTIPSGSLVTYTASCVISSLATGTLSNTATVNAQAGGNDPATGNNSATDSDTLTPSANLAITKTDGVTSVTAGGSTTYTITASNSGPSSAPGTTVADTFPASLTCTWGCVGAGGGTCTASGSGNINDSTNLPSGGSVTYTASCTISPSATGTLSNTATVTATGGVTDPTPANNSATDSDTIGASADLSITKTDGVTTVTAGGSTTYTITASNAGPSNATGTTVADTFPASLTCSWGCVGAGGGTCTASGSGNINDSTNLPSGGSVTYTASCTISPAATGTLSNTATVTAPGGVTDSVPGNNSATDSDTIGASADLAITKTDGVTSVTAGGSTTYTITASNAGPSSVTGTTVADTFPASLTCNWGCVGAGGGTCTASGSGNINDSTNLPPGGSITYTANCTISPSATGTLSNTATVTAPGGVTDSVPGNNSATDSDTIGASADLSITKTDGVTSVTAGGTTTYTITASNAGPSTATGTTVADTFPASLSCTWGCVGAGGGTCTASGSGNINDSTNLPSGGSVTYTANCTISPAATGTISNTATVTAPGGVTDSVPGNNSATDSDTVGGSADLSITKTDGVTTATAGGSTTYTITATNAGPSSATGATVADAFPASLTCTWGCVGAAGGTCTGSGSGNISDSVNLPPGGTVTYTANCTISSSATGTLSNTATVTAPAGVIDSAPGNNSATDSDTLASPSGASVSGTKTVSGTFVVGSNVTYVVTLTNNGTGAQGDNPGNEFTDVLPPQLALVSATASSGTPGASVGTNTVTWNGSIPVGGSVTITITATILPAPVGTMVTNQGTISYDSDGNGTNDASAQTDDPGAAGSANGTGFAIAPAVAQGIPVASPFGLVLMMLALGLAALGMMKRS